MCSPGWSTRSSIDIAARHMDNILWSLAALIAWAALLYKLRDLLHEPARQSLRLICATLVCVALTATFGSTPVQLAFDRLVGIPNLAELMLHACGMGFVIAVQRLLLHWVYPAEQARRRARRWQSLYVLAFIAQVVLFILAPVDEETTDFIVRYADTPFAREFMLLIDVCVLLTVTDIARLCGRYASVAGRRFLRVGLRCTGIAAILGIVYFVLEALYVVGRAAHTTLIPDHLVEPLYTFFGVGFVLLLTVGLTIPAWGPKLAAATAWISRYRAYRRLHVLWLALYQASPQIALDATTTLKDRLWLNDLDYRLVRRVVEIRDGRLALRPYLSATTARHARRAGEQAGLHGIALQAAVEAATIADAIRAKREHAEPSDPYALGAPGGADLASEAAWLGHVARAMTVLASRPRLARKTTRSGRPHDPRTGTARQPTP